MCACSDFANAFHFVSAKNTSDEEVKDSLVESTFIERSIFSAGIGTKNILRNQTATGFATWNWIVNKNLFLGLSGESVLVSKKRKFADEMIAEYSVWYIGPRFEYIVWRNNLLNVSTGSAVHYGNIGFRAEDENSEEKWYSSGFTSIEPFAKISLNFSKQVEIGSQVFYAVAVGSKLYGVKNSDLSGIGGNLFLARRF